MLLYTSGTECKDHPTFSKHHLCLRLHLYMDEFEVVNPLGSKKSKHKLLAVYFPLGNLGAKLTTKLKHIFLISLCKSMILLDPKYSYEDILKPLVEDLKNLSNDGIPVDVNGSPLRISGAVATVSTDNLGAHQPGAFT